MKVLLRRGYFSRLGRFRKSIPKSAPVDVPDELRDELPSDAVIVDDTYVAPVVVVKEPETLSEAARMTGNALDRDASEELNRIQNKELADPEAERQKRANEFEAALAAERANKVPKEDPTDA